MLGVAAGACEVTWQDPSEALNRAELPVELLRVPVLRSLFRRATALEKLGRETEVTAKLTQEFLVATHP